MKKVCSAIMVALLIGFFANACASQTVDVDGLAKSEIYQSGPASLAEVYDKFSDLCSKAQYIAEVDVTDKAEEIVYSDMPFTITTVKVNSAIKGDVPSGGEIRVLETGGHVKGADMDLGVPLLKKGQHLILMLEAFEGPQAKDCYVPVGAYQGKFIEKQGYYMQQTTEDAVAQDYKPMTRDEFVKAVKGA
jgi:hypothetical protein